MFNMLSLFLTIIVFHNVLLDTLNCKVVAVTSSERIPCLLLRATYNSMLSVTLFVADIYSENNKSLLEGLPHF